MYEEIIAALRFCDNGECDGCCKYIKGKGTGCYTLLRDAADAIEDLSREYESIAASLNESVELVRKLQSPRWVSVTERLPEDSGDYLVYDSCGNIFQNFYGTVVRRWSARNGMVTHWMPLPPAPEPPKEET